MSYTVKIPKLIQHLMDAEDVSAEYTKPLNFLKDQPESIRYLYTSFVEPIIKENSVSISGLDMDKFEYDDLKTIWELYRDKIGPDSSCWTILRQIYSICKKTEPERHTISFI